MIKPILATVAAVTVVATAAFFSLDKHLRYLLTHPPTDTDVLFWSLPQRDGAFRNLDRFAFLAEANVIEAGRPMRALPQGAPLALDFDLDSYMTEQRTAAIVVLQNGAVRLEQYGLDFDAEGRWTSFSVAKSFTSTLVGAAIADGFINSLDDKVSAYIPGLQGSAYDDVTIQQLLTMTSGVRWNEDYEDPNSDVARFGNHQPEPGIDATVSYMRKLPREAPAGSKWVYKTGETNLIGVLVASATGKSLASYLSEKIWQPYGMEQDGSWLLGRTGLEISGCCIQAATRDYARFGQFMLDGGTIGGRPVLPPGWVAKATTKAVDIGRPGKGYGYQWWTYDDGSYAAQGIFGQGIFIDPQRQLVIASNSNWPRASDYTTVGRQREAFYAAVQQAVDREGAGTTSP